MRRHRVAAAILSALAVGGWTLVVAEPAAAQDCADLGVVIAGTSSIAQEARYKPGVLSLRNHGPGNAIGMEYIVDISDLDTSKVVFLHQAFKFTAGTTVDGRMPLIHISPAATGDAGTLTVTVS